MAEQNVEPEQKSEEEQDKDFFISICLRGANDIRGLLKMDDAGYTRISFSAHQDARNYYIYGVLDELEKAGVALMGYREVLKDTSAETHDRISRNVTASIVDQQMVWVRKLTEILAELILFSKTNTLEHFKHYLLVNHLVDLKKVIDDTKEYFACENLNHKYQKDETSQRIQTVEVGFDLSSCWYLQDQSGGGKHSGTKGKLSTFKSKLEQAYMMAAKDQKLALGTTYGNAYGKSSQSLHPNLTGSDPDIDSKNIEIGISQIGILAAHILILCKKLLKDKRRKGFVAQLSRVFHKNEYPEQLFKSRVNPSIKKGGFVIAYGDIAEVIKINKSKYGYRSFTVRYLGNPPLPQIPVDSFPSMFVRKFYDRKTIASEVKARIKESTPDLKISDRKVADSLRKTATDMWEKLGFKERYYGRHDLANKKIEEYLEQAKKEKLKGQ